MNILSSEKYNVVFKRFGPLLLLLAGAVFIFLAAKKPIGDFGNYYYGSKIYADHKSLDSLYSDIHWFNEQIASYGEKDFFENYVPVPPFSLLFYRPFTLLQPHQAKILFNILSLLIFVFSFRRFTRYFLPAFPVAYILPLLLFYPFYQNILQGQAYLLVCASLMETGLQYEKRNYWSCAFLIALLFHLKLFPAFILLFFLFKKDWRILLYSLITISIFFIPCFIFIGKEVLQNYFLEIFPRFFRGEVIDPNYYGHQGLDVFLKRIFGDASFLFVLFSGILTAFVIYAGWRIVKTPDRQAAWGFFIFLSVFLSTYTTVYSLIILIPFLAILAEGKGNIMVIFLILVACNVPLHRLADAILLLKFARIELFILAFLLYILRLKLKMNLPALLLCLALILPLKLIQMEKGKKEALTIPGEGFAYQLSLQDDKLLAGFCMGDHHSEKVVAEGKKIVLLESPGLIQKLTGGKELVKTAYFDGSRLFYLSDKGRGKGLYGLWEKNFDH